MERHRYHLDLHIEAIEGAMQGMQKVHAVKILTEETLRAEGIRTYGGASGHQILYVRYVLGERDHASAHIAGAEIVERLFAKLKKVGLKIKGWDVRTYKSAPARKGALGVKLGQPSKFERYRAELVKMMGEGVAKKEMARRTGLSVPTVRKYLNMIEME